MCGLTGRRRKRALNTVMVNFRFTITLPTNFTDIKIVDLDQRVSKVFSDMTYTMRQQITTSKFDTLGISGMQVDVESYTTQRKKLDCAIGMTPRLSTYTCGNIIVTCIFI